MIEWIRHDTSTHVQFNIAVREAAHSTGINERGYHACPGTPRSATLNTVDEPLNLSAPLAWQLASQLCAANIAATGVDCSATHAIWQYLRLLGLIGSLDARADFYWRAFDDVTGGADSPRVLIAGTADYSMLAHTIAAFRARGVEPRITVVDLCETPLALNRWYAERSGCRIETCRTDIFGYESGAAFDAVCTDSFIARFPHAQWPRLCEKWHDLLRTGGLFITDNRLRPSNADARVVFSAEKIRTFIAEVLRASTAAGATLGVDPAALAHQAGRYAQSHFAYPLRAPEQLGSLLECAGFRLERLTVETVIAESAAALSGPSTRGGGQFVRTVASRL